MPYVAKRHLIWPLIFVSFKTILDLSVTLAFFSRVHLQLRKEDQERWNKGCHYPSVS